MAASVELDNWNYVTAPLKHALQGTFIDFWLFLDAVSLPSLSIVPSNKWLEDCIPLYSFLHKNQEIEIS